MDHHLKMFDYADGRPVSRAVVKMRFLAGFMGTISADAGAVLYRRFGWENQNFSVEETKVKMPLSHPSRDGRQKCMDLSQPTSVPEMLEMPSSGSADRRIWRFTVSKAAERSSRCRTEDWVTVFAVCRDSKDMTISFCRMTIAETRLADIIFNKAEYLFLLYHPPLYDSSGQAFLFFYLIKKHFY